MRKPWFRKGRGYFVTTDGGKQVKLGDTEQEAYAEWEKLKSASIDGPDPYVAAIINAFVTSIENTRSKATHAWYSPYLLAFLSEHDTKTVGQLKRHHLTRWAESKFPTKGARTAAIRSVKSCFNWAVDEEVIKSSPFARVQTPASGRRETLVTVETQNQILADLGNWRNRRPFRLVLIAMRLSGCRPGEIRVVTAEHFRSDMEAWVFARHKTKDATGITRVVHLHPCLATLSRILAWARPSGPLFLNADKQPWQKNAVVDRMRRLREKFNLPQGTVAYSFRHGYITEGIVNGVDVATMATLTGTSVEMIAKHYGHLDQKSAHLKIAAHRAIGSRAAPAPQNQSPSKDAGERAG
jgi:integrase